MKKILVAVAIAALTMGSMTAADARIGASSGRSSVSTSSVSRSTSISSGSRIGGSMGVSNPSVMAAVRAPQPTRNYGNINANSTATKTVTSSVQTTTRTNTNNYYNNAGVRSGGYYGGGSPGYYPHPGYSGGTVAAAAVAGAVGGAMLANSGNHGTTIINNGAGGGVPVYGNGGPVYSNGGAVYAAPAVPVAPSTTVYVEHHSAIWTFLGWILAIVVIVLLVRFFIRLMSSQTSNAIYEGPGDYASSSSSTTTRTTRTTTTTVDAEEERAINKGKQLLASATQFYRQLQNANNRGDKAALRAMMTPEMFAQIEEGIDQRDGQPGTTTVKEIRVYKDEVLALRQDGDVYRGSIHFKGLVNEGGAQDDAVDEVFHYFAEGVNGPWKLEGIESV